MDSEDGSDECSPNVENSLDKTKENEADNNEQSIERSLPNPTRKLFIHEQTFATRKPEEIIDKVIDEIDPLESNDQKFKWFLTNGIPKPSVMTSMTGVYLLIIVLLIVVQICIHYFDGKCTHSSVYLGFLTVSLIILLILTFLFFFHLHEIFPGCSLLTVGSLAAAIKSLAHVIFASTMEKGCYSTTFQAGYALSIILTILMVISSILSCVESRKELEENPWDPEGNQRRLKHSNKRFYDDPEKLVAIVDIQSNASQ